MNFITAFLGTCRGSVSFIALRKQPGYKVALHLFLVLLVSCICISIGRYSALEYQWSYIEHKFVETFGTEISWGKSGIVPDKEPSVSRDLELSYDGLLIYAADKVNDYPDSALETRNFIAVWTRRGFVYAFNDKAKSRWMVMNMMPLERKNMFAKAQQFKALSYTELRTMLKDIQASANEPVGDALASLGEDVKFRVHDIFRGIYVFMAFYNGLAYFLRGLYLLAFGTLVYMGIFFFLNRFPGEKTALSGWEMCKVVIYAAFPVIVVVNLFPMLQLPFEDFYNNIFLISWLIYVNVVRRFLEKNRDLLEAQEM